MNKRLIYILIILSGLFFLLSLYLFFSSKAHEAAPPSAPEKTAPQVYVPMSLLKVKLFFFRESSEEMIPVNRVIEVPETREVLYRNFLNSLLAGEKGYIMPIPEGLTVRTLYYLPAKGLLVVDFDELLLTRFPGGTAAEEEFVYFIVNNICFNFKEIKKVRFFAGGNEIRSSSWHLDMEKAYLPDLSRLQTESD
jgi:hypothetical protein